MTPPLFILAPGRSFTSISCGMIGCHPQLYGVAEINLFATDTVGELLKVYQLYTSVRRYLDQGLLRTLAELAFGEQTEETIDAARAWLAENSDLRTDELFRDLQEWSGGKGIVDKSPFNVHAPMSLARIKRTIPEARYLHLTRHPGDTIKSGFEGRRAIREKTLARYPRLAPLIVDQENFESKLMPRKAFRDGSAEEVPDKAWLTPHRTIMEFLEDIPADKQMRMRGEDLLSDPRKHLAVIAQWLGVGSSEADIEAMMHPETSPYAKYGPDNARFGNDPNFIEHPELRPYSYKPKPLEWTTEEGQTIVFNDAIRTLATKFGY